MKKVSKKPTLVTYGNVLDDLGFSPEHATALKFKAELYQAILKFAKKYSQKGTPSHPRRAATSRKRTPQRKNSQQVRRQAPSLRRPPGHRSKSQIHSNPQRTSRKRTRPRRLVRPISRNYSLTLPANFSVFPKPVISNGAGRRFFFPLRSCEAVGLRREKSLLSFVLPWNDGRGQSKHAERSRGFRLSTRQADVSGSSSDHLPLLEHSLSIENR